MLYKVVLTLEFADEIINYDRDHLHDSNQAALSCGVYVSRSITDTGNELELEEFQNNDISDFIQSCSRIHFFSVWVKS